MTDPKSSYRQIIKATSLFGGVQVLRIIMQIIRSKAIAILLGPAGMGVAGLFTSTIALIGSMTHFGLGVSAVKDIASARESDDDLHVGRLAGVLRRLVWFTGIFGALLTFSGASWLSEWSFGNTDYALAFRWLSLTLLFNQLANAQFVVLQGLRKLKDLAKANVAGAVLGLLVSLPLYYYFRMEGIVPAIILTAGITLLVNRYYTGKVRLPKVNVTLSDTHRLGKDMLLMGFMLSLSGILVVGSLYVIRIFISNTGSVEEVGLFDAGYAIINSYVGFIFTAMATDYYPRLSAVAEDQKAAGTMINQQADITILILAPVLVVFMVFIRWILILLYSKEFTGIDTMLQWMALGMFFKASSWAVGFIFLARGASRLFFWNELVATIYMLSINLTGYYYFGLEGLGVSFLIYFALYFLQVFLLTHYKYRFTFTAGFYQILGFQLALALACFFMDTFMASPWKYWAGLVIVVISCGYSLRELDKRLDLKDFLRKGLKK